MRQSSRTSCVGASLVGISLAHLVGDVGNSLSGVVVGGVGRSKAGEEEDDGEEGHDEDAELAEDGFASTKLGPVAGSLASVTLDLVVAELVVNHAAESNGVTEELEGSNGSAPDHHGGNNEENVLQDTAEGENDSGGLANL